ncbi:uncharacterized protein RAG0_04354 [Rhynchosporium agropyri]|uniref:Kinesin light chain n=1 Tax=Rhynchosporium agropyri TaxID=914238 RepID=A0A1E1K8B6_9HELO|nr:uncharacterized protein RAG0_04354 [Rhynchosporium agropyri]
MAAKLKNTDTASAEDASPFMLEAFRNFDSIRDYFSASKNGTIVVTSRNSASKDLANHQPSHFFELGGLSDEESVTLLQERSQLEMAKIDTIAAKAILYRLACHPLAITQASSYISRKKIRLSQFLDHYEKSRAQILKHTPNLNDYRRQLSEDEEETSLNVFTTWELSLQQLLETKDSGKENFDLLTLISFFDCKDVSEELFSSYTPRAQSWPAEYYWPVDCLAFCLSNEEYPDGQLLGGCEKFGEILTDLSEMSLVQPWAWGEDDYRHCYLHPLIKDHDTRLANVDAIISIFLDQCGRYTEAEVINRRLVDFSAKNFGLKDKDTLRCMNNLAVTYSYQGKLKLAENLYRQVLEEFQALLGSDHADTPRSISALARILMDTGIENKDTLSSLHILAMILRYQKDYGEREKILERVLAVREKLLGPSHENTLFTVGELGMLWRDMGDLDGAEKMIRRSLKGVEISLGSDHRSTLGTVSPLGLVLQDIGRLVEAENMMLRSIEGETKLSGRQRTTTLKSIWNLAGILRDQRKFTESQELWKEALEGLQKALGDDYYHTINCLAGYSNLMGMIAAETSSEITGPIEDDWETASSSSESDSGVQTTIPNPAQ